MKKIALVLFAFLATSLTQLSYAQFAKADDAVKYRQAAFTILGTHFSRVGAMATGKAPYDAKVAQENIDIAVAASKLPWAAFGPSAKEATAKNSANAEIWSEPAKFKEHADKMQAELVKLQTAAKTNNLDSLKATFGAVGASCKACHDTYRAK